MQQFRASLTRLKTLIEQKVPDGNDVYGTPGVSRASLLAALDAAYRLSMEIKEGDETRFEVIGLKRTAAALYKSLKDFLDLDPSEQDKRAIGFGGFLDNLIALIHVTKLTYFVVAKNGMRDDEELARIRSTIADLTVLSDDFKAKQTEVASEVGSITATIDAINTHHKNAEQATTELKQWHDTASTQYAEIDKTHKAITGWDEEIKERSDDFDAQSKQIVELTAAAAQCRDKLSADAATGEKHAEVLTKVAREHRELIEEIRLTLEGANRVGMAASFNARKRELRWEEGVWQTVFVGAMASIVAAVYWLVLPSITDATTHWSELVGELGIVSPLIWLGWFAAKQYGYTSKIREDYAFKAASAMAYEGHKKAAREANKDLESMLLEFSMYNMAQNPI